MNIAIVGSRNYPDREFVEKFVRKVHKKYGSSAIIVSGGALGVDNWAETIARSLQMGTLCFKPNIPKGTGRKEAIQLLMDRNTEIVYNSHKIVAFHNQYSTTHGTLDTVYKAIRLIIPTYVYDANKGLWGPEKEDLAYYMKSVSTYYGPIP